MSKTLQEQLLQSGIAKPKQAKKARREKTRQAQAARRDGKTPDEQAALAREIAAKDAGKRDYDRRLNEQRKAQREAQEKQQMAAQIIDQNRIKAEGDGDNAVAYNYTVKGKIKRIMVSDAQRRSLAAGRMAIVRHRGNAALVTAAIAERLQPLIPERVWLATPEDDTPDPDDPYAAYQVPDDLMW
ncbi:DUF2058 domain-containing protein [Endozoicomonas sp. G2_2]|uniref:DUF2058 domain-containing protein n=1 Tax=Endozoicomonas sp. G2_2 TaxID=2821092 RepID=UPI001AD9CC25|nr:DUF2058 family protein [Endozoicomonas sp. G2_2]MBO9470861.1 DUF2058 domain-containing protein [Endozoicomonas sp. G2_2]